jgi:hypothetical protein
MLHPDTELRIVNDVIGYGVFATRPIPRGTITWVLDPLDQVLDQRRARELEESLGHVLDRYTWLDCHGERILCWDFARFMNHSCEANSFSPGGFDFEIAVRDLAAGEELTSDYGSLNLEVSLACECRSLLCRGLVQPDDFAVLAPSWDEKIRSAFSLLRTVNQPLWPWVARHEKSIARMAKHPEALPSILKHRWLPAELAVASEVGRLTV